MLSASGDKTSKIWDVNVNSVVSTFPMGSNVLDQQLGCLWQKDHLLSISLSGYINYLDKNNPSKPLRVIKVSLILSMLWVESRVHWSTVKGGKQWESSVRFPWPWAFWQKSAWYFGALGASSTVSSAESGSGDFRPLFSAAGSHCFLSDLACCSDLDCTSQLQMRVGT